MLQRERFKEDNPGNKACAIIKCERRSIKKCVDHNWGWRPYDPAGLLWVLPLIYWGLHWGWQADTLGGSVRYFAVYLVNLRVRVEGAAQDRPKNAPHSA